MAILRLKTHIFALAYSVFFFYSFHVDFQNLHEFHVDFFKTLTVEFYMKTVEKKKYGASHCAKPGFSIFNSVFQWSNCQETSLKWLEIVS